MAEIKQASPWLFEHLEAAQRFSNFWQSWTTSLAVGAHVGHLCKITHIQKCMQVNMRNIKLSAYQEKIPARNAISAHAQDFAASDELLLAILKAFIPQPLNKQRTIGVHVFS
jgi:hypothetical protein